MTKDDFAQREQETQRITLYDDVNCNTGTKRA
jgi:hypothetical protein